MRGLGQNNQSNDPLGSVSRLFIFLKHVYQNFCMVRKEVPGNLKCDFKEKAFLSLSQVDIVLVVSRPDTQDMSSSLTITSCEEYQRDF